MKETVVISGWDLLHKTYVMFPCNALNSSEKCEKYEKYWLEGANNFACDSETLINGVLARDFLLISLHSKLTNDAVKWVHHVKPRNQHST